MRIGLQIPDPTLRVALVDLLRSAGHEVIPFLDAGGQCKLRILATPIKEAAPEGTATLVLRRESGATVAEYPASDLRTAIEAGGTVTWDAPLDVAMLLGVLGSTPTPRPCPPPRVSPGFRRHGW